VFAFSSEKWKRPTEEVSGLMGLVLVAALVIATVLDGLLRASYETISREALHILGVRRRAHVSNLPGFVRDFLSFPVGAGDSLMDVGQIDHDGRGMLVERGCRMRALLHA
jgi:hypothetical protein